MSEYQHYTFHAIDRPLSAEAQAAVAKMSSRVELSPYQAVFTYSYSDFPHDEMEVLTSYFDAMLYGSNYGSKRLLLKFPADLVDFKQLLSYQIATSLDYINEIDVLKKEDFVLLDIQYNEEPTGQWYDASDGHPLLGIRNEILQGDYRSLFVIWLRFLEFKYLSEYFEEDFEEDFDEDFGFEQGFIPPNLHALSPIGQAAQDWFEVSPYWLAAVQALSPSQTVDFDAEALLAHLPPERMRAYLLMLLRDEANVKTRLLQELKASQGQPKTGGDEWIFLKQLGEQVAEMEQQDK